MTELKWKMLFKHQKCVTKVSLWICIDDHFVSVCRLMEMCFFFCLFRDDDEDDDEDESKDEESPVKVSTYFIVFAIGA